jgi:predicted Zn finger-like uncharacterized protein
MQITCSNCQTQFNLNDSLYSPERRLRCSVCLNVFTLAEEMPFFVAEDIPVASMPNAQDNQFQPPSSLPEELEAKAETEKTSAAAYIGPKPAPPKSLAKKTLMAAAFLVCLAGLGFGGYIIYTDWSKKHTSAYDPIAEEITDLDKVKGFALNDVKQYSVDNNKLGRVIVIEGKIKNNFNTSKDLIVVEASLYDKKGKVIATQQQYAGVTMNPLQLQILGKDEMAKALTNKFEIYGNNQNVTPGMEVPFMVVFIFPPSSMTQFGVRVIDAQDPPNQQAQPTR